MTEVVSSERCPRELYPSAATWIHGLRIVRVEYDFESDCNIDVVIADHPETEGWHAMTEAGEVAAYFPDGTPIPAPGEEEDGK